MKVPIQTVHLFPKLDEKLLELLRSLERPDWGKFTLASKWTVKDVAAHLLDGNIRLLSVFRDNFFNDQPGNIESYTDLVSYLNQLNADWVHATKRMSPSVLIELLEITGKEYCEVISKLDPFSEAIFSVAWAGQQSSPNWFHIAREYTEKWHHQQQIREAVSRPAIMTREFYHPLIATFMQALPYTYRSVDTPAGIAIKVIVTTDVGGTWVLIRNESKWKLAESFDGDFMAEVTLKPDTAWKLFTKAISEEQAEKEMEFSGDRSLGKHVLHMRSVMV